MLRDNTDGNVGKLVKLSDTELMFADSREDVRDRQVIDRNGEDLGHVDALLIDDQEKRVRFLSVASGGFLGLGESTFLLPVDAITRVSTDQVVVDQTRERVGSAPAYNPELTYDQAYYGDLYDYYGYGPYWAPGYAAPVYPLV